MSFFRNDKKQTSTVAEVDFIECSNACIVKLHHGSFLDHLGHGAEFADARASMENEDCLACRQMLHSDVSATIMDHFLAEGVFVAPPPSASRS